MNKTKVNITKEEMAILRDVVFFTAKKRATGKISKIFAELRDEVKNVTKKSPVHFPERTDLQTGKLSKGENYQGLPYIILDFPKLFSKETVFAFRTMFWWGNFFSCTLHLQGKALEEWRKNKAPLHLSPKGRGLNFQAPSHREGRGGLLYICVNNNPWQYHYKKDNYLPINKLSDSELKNLLLKKEFLKLSMQIPIKDHKKLVKFVKESFLYLYPER